jgi:hypothetical protein
VILLLNDWDTDGAETAIRQSPEIDPEYSLGHTWFAIVLAIRLRFDECPKVVQQSLVFDPLSITSQLVACRCYFWAGRVPEALQYAQAVVDACSRNILAVAW